MDLLEQDNREDIPLVHLFEIEKRKQNNSLCYLLLFFENLYSIVDSYLTIGLMFPPLATFRLMLTDYVSAIKKCQKKKKKKKKRQTEEIESHEKSNETIPK